MTADQLRHRFRALPQTTRDANQSFAIRVWRGLSWLERCEQLDANDHEERMIFGWIAFNALYGRLGIDGRAERDREAMELFLAKIWRLDHNGLLHHELHKRELPVLKAIENKYLYDKFWMSPSTNVDHELRTLVREFMQRFVGRNLLPVLQTLMDRLYVMRNQVIHGASTKGSKLNRRAVQACSHLLAGLVPLMIDIMIAYGTNEDWGEVCYPPR